MGDRDDVYDRFGFSLPEDYVQFWEAGLLVNDYKKGLQLSRLSWLSPHEIAHCAWPSTKIKSLVPCAQTPGRDHFCWVFDSHGRWIADCPRDSKFAEGFAPNFEAMVFRSLLHEFADTWIFEDLPPSDIAAIFRQYSARVSALLRPRWSAILVACGKNFPTRNRWGRPQVIPQEEVTAIVERELSFPMLGRTFTQSID